MWKEASVASTNECRRRKGNKEIIRQLTNGRDKEKEKSKSEANRHVRKSLGSKDESVIYKNLKKWKGTSIISEEWRDLD